MTNQQTTHQAIAPPFIPAPPPYHYQPEQPPVASELGASSSLSAPVASQAVSPPVLFRYGWNDLPRAKLPDISAKNVADGIDWFIKGLVITPFALAGIGIAVGAVAAIGTFLGFTSFLSLIGALRFMGHAEGEKYKQYASSIGCLYILSFVGTFCALYLTGVTDTMAAGFSHIDVDKFRGDTIEQFISFNFASSLSLIVASLLTACYSALAERALNAEDGERERLGV